MKRAVCTGAGMGALTAAWFYCLAYVYLTVDSDLYVNLVIAGIFAAAIALLYMWAGRGHYGKSFLFWLLFAFLFAQFLPSPNAMYREVNQTEGSLGGNGWFGLTVNLMFSFPVFVMAFGSFCLMFYEVFNRNQSAKTLGNKDEQTGTAL